MQVGSQIPAEVLIKGMIVQSGNDATIALAERVGGTESAFVQLMNEFAQRLGMSGTHFDDSSGLPAPTHYTTARDLSRLASALVRDYPQYYGWFSLHEFVWNNIKQDNRNGLLERDPTVDGMKTGHTDSAGYCLVTSAKRDGMRLIGVVLGSSSVKGREDASAALLNYGYTFYERRRQEGGHRGSQATRVQGQRGILLGRAGHRHQHRSTTWAERQHRDHGECAPPAHRPAEYAHGGGRAAGTRGRQSRDFRAALSARRRAVGGRLDAAQR